MKQASRLERGFGLPCITLATACTVLAGCGGSSGTPPPDNAARAQAATATAQNHSNCSAIRPFYWEIGNQSSALASGSIELAGSSGAATYTATTAMPIASASKWLYGAYVAQKRAGVLSAQDITHLHFTSGYTNFNLCAQTDTIKSCLDRGNNGLYSPGTDGKFFYNGGHMQKHASLMGLDAMDDAALAIEVGGQLGITVAYSQPQPAGGVYSNASTYAVYLRKLLNGQLQMNQLLGSSPVCTSTDTACGAGSTPSPPDRALALLDRPLGRGRPDGRRRRFQQRRCLRLLPLDRRDQDLLRRSGTGRRRRHGHGFGDVRTPDPQSLGHRYRAAGLSDRRQAPVTPLFGPARQRHAMRQAAHLDIQDACRRKDCTHPPCWRESCWQLSCKECAAAVTLTDLK